jgi:integrase
MRQKNKSKRRSPKTVLRLPDLDHSKSSVLQTLGSVASQKTYAFAIDDFISWYCSEPRLAFGRTVVLRYRYFLEARHLAPATINLRLAAVRRLAYEASDNGLLSPDLAAGIRRVKGAKRLGMRIGNWLTPTQGKELLGMPDRDSVKGKRNYAMLAVLLGCGLRRAELTRLTVNHLQQRDNHWAIIDLFGKGGHVRTVPVPDWVKVAMDSWIAVACIETGVIFRCLSRTGHVWGSRLSEKAVWWVVREYAKLAGIEHLAPHDLRRTCARLCHSAGGELEQIQFLLGHRSVETTERYLGSRQRLVQAVNDHIGIEPEAGQHDPFDSNQG